MTNHWRLKSTFHRFHVFRQSFKRPETGKWERAKSYGCYIRNMKGATPYFPFQAWLYWLQPWSVCQVAGSPLNSRPIHLNNYWMDEYINYFRIMFISELFSRYHHINISVSLIIYVEKHQQSQQLTCQPQPQTTTKVQSQTQGNITIKQAPSTHFKSFVLYLNSADVLSITRFIVL